MRLGALARGAGAEFCCAAGGVTGPDGRGATIGRAAGPAPGAAAGIMGRGGNIIGRPLAGWGDDGAGCGDAIGGFDAGARSTTVDGGAARFGSGTNDGIAAGGGVGPFGTRAGSEVSRRAAASAALARCAATASATSVGRLAFVVGAALEENSSSIDEPDEIVMTPPHTEHRARTIVDGSFAGSTRNVERHSGQETFTSPPSRSCRLARGAAGSRLALRRFDDRSRRPSLEVSWRSSSSLLQVHSLAPRA